MDPLYLAQVVFACMLVLCSCLGNTTACISMKLFPVPKCPYFVNLMILELVAVMFGPVAYLVTVFVDPGWLKEGTTSTCIGTIFFQKFSLIGSLLSLTFLAWSHCHKRELPQKKIVVVFSILSTWFLPAILSLCAFMAQKSHFLDIPWFMCSTTTTFQGYTLIGVVIVAIAACVHSFSLWLSFSSIMSKNIYYMQDHWKRHKREITVNDPECSTFHMSYSESTSVSLDKIYNVTLPGKKNSVGQISFFNASRNWTINHQPEIPKTSEGKTEKNPKTNSDSNEVFYDNDRMETSKSSLEDGVGIMRRSTALDSVFSDVPDACVSTQQSFDSKSSVESMKSACSTDESSSRTLCPSEHAVAPCDAPPSEHSTDGTDATSETPNSTKIPAHSPVTPSPATETSFSNAYSRVEHPAMTQFPSASSRSSTSPIKNRMTSLSPSKQMTPSAGIYSSYSPGLTTSPWYYLTSPYSNYYITTPGFGDIRKYKRAKYISPTTLDFAKTDRTISESKKLVLLVTCMSMIGWLLFSVVLILKAAGFDLPVEVWRLSTMVLFVKSAMTPVLYVMCFSRHRVACKKFIKSKLPLNPGPEKKCSLKLNDATVIGAYLAQDDCASGVQLEKYSVLP